MLENQVAITLQLESLVLNVLPQMCQNEVLGVNNLNSWDKFIVLKFKSLKENHQYAFGCTSNLTCLLRSQLLISTVFFPLCCSSRPNNHYQPWLLTCIWVIPSHLGWWRNSDEEISQCCFCLRVWTLQIWIWKICSWSYCLHLLHAHYCAVLQLCTKISEILHCNSYKY